VKRGIFFSLTVISLFGLLLFLSSNYLLARSHSGELLQVSLLRKLAYSWDDVSEDVVYLLNTSVTQVQNNITVQDNLPAPRSITASLSAYANFVHFYYQPSDLNFTFLSPGGLPVPLENLGPPLQILPWGFNYSYPDYGKNELFIQVPDENFSAMRRLYINISLPFNSFTENPTTIENNPCSLFTAFKTCNHGTKDCLNVSIRIVDNTSLTWVNTGCTQIDANDNSNLQLNLNYSGGNGWLKILIGKLPALVDTQMQNAWLSANTTFEMNSTDVHPNLAAYLRVASDSFNASKTARIG